MVTPNQAVRPSPSKWRRRFAVPPSRAGAAHGQRWHRRNHGLLIGMARSAGEKTEIIHQQLGLTGTGDFCDYGDAPVVGRQLPSGWYVIVVKGCDHKLISDVIVQQISSNCSVIACSIEEHVMFSSAAQWSDGQKEWAIQHRGGDYGPTDLSFEGDPPPLFSELREHYGSRQNAEGIKSCVFHYEVEFIHPFQDGNGRMGRFWQTRILMDENPIFAYLPVEAAIKKNQAGYYQSLAASDAQGKSTIFIEFILKKLRESLDEVLETAVKRKVDYETRVAFALSQLEGWFDRKRYLEVCKNVSTATASRDLKQMIEDHLVQVSGSGRMTRYRKKL
jgi:hypothetical protein